MRRKPGSTIDPDNSLWMDRLPYIRALYDRTVDPCEITNVIDDPEYDFIRRDLDARLVQHMQETSDDWRIIPGKWPAPGYTDGGEGALEATQKLIEKAMPNPVLQEWPGRVDRSSDAP